MARSAYIHIPFCKSKCKYCSFVSFADCMNTSSYIKALLKEIEFYYKGEILNTLYFGGGTPSLLDTKFVSEMISRFNLAKDCEVTFEINPDDVTLEYLESLKLSGVNRISMGAQTFDDVTLKLIGRRHNSKQIIEAVEMAKQAGFDNISLDLIYGLPNQTLEMLTQNLDMITSLDIQHVSTYGLKIEEESFWGKYPPENIPDDDLQADMYILINEYLLNKGFSRYEISNFSKENFESRHNLNYWDNAEYYGFGVAAHGYLDGIRYSNECDLKRYLSNPLLRSDEHNITIEEQLQEEIFLGFRKESGVNIVKIKEKFDIDFEKLYKTILDKYTPEYIVKTEQNYKLTLQGVLLSNNILSDFI